ncbi:hypothetical protein [Aggregatibacter segnis]|nr:hypothetical protein [Aggregatibacter segnis]
MLPIKNCYGKNGTYQKRRILCLYQPQSAVKIHRTFLFSSAELIYNTSI